MNKLMLMISVYCCSASLYAAHVLPVFSGDWYTSVSYDFIDACSNTNYTYENKLQGDVDSDPEWRHAKWPVLIQPEIARYEDIGK